MKRLKDILDFIIAVVKSVLLVVVSYFILSFINWSIDIPEWGAFSRFMLGLVSVVAIFKIREE
jgi:hypothetical protein